MVPRHLFAPTNKENAALAGKKLIFENSSLEVPSIDVHVQILQALQLQQGHTFLELGCGAGYLLTVAKYLIGRSEAVGIDGDQVATRFTKEALLKLNQERKFDEVQPSVQETPIPDFFSTTQQFDRIVVSVSFPKVSTHLLQSDEDCIQLSMVEFQGLLGVLKPLLRSNGKMVVPVEGKLLLMEKVLVLFNGG